MTVGSVLQQTDMRLVLNFSSMSKQRKGINGFPKMLYYIWESELAGFGFNTGPLTLVKMNRLIFKNGLDLPGDSYCIKSPMRCVLSLVCSNTQLLQIY